VHEVLSAWVAFACSDCLNLVGHPATPYPSIAKWVPSPAGAFQVAPAVAKKIPTSSPLDQSCAVVT
jgi:hypothetical protein